MHLQPRAAYVSSSAPRHGNDSSGAHKDEVIEYSFAVV